MPPAGEEPFSGPGPSQFFISVIANERLTAGKELTAVVRGRDEDKISYLMSNKVNVEVTSLYVRAAQDRLFSFDVQ
jgi:hypothetical protein